MKNFLILLTIICSSLSATAQQGKWFDKTEPTVSELPKFETLKEVLPQPIFDENPKWVDTYWKAWEIACKNFYNPTLQNGFVSPYIDAAFNNCIFMWDTSFMTMFCNYGHPYVPGITSLDNFYCKQYDNGEISREISREDGKDCPLWVNDKAEPLFSRWGFDVPRKFEKVAVKYIGREAPTTVPHHTLDNMNHPIMAWAELESYYMTGDKARLEMVYEPLRHQYDILKEYLRQGNNLYMTDWASMDNSMRNSYLKSGGTAIDTSCEMVLFAKNLIEIAKIIDSKEDLSTLHSDIKITTTAVNNLMWSDKDGFYYDLTAENSHVGVKSVAAYWSMLSGVADNERATMLAKQLTNPQTFGRRNLVPTLAADQKSFSSDGDYWCGSVWAPTTMMVIDGLELYGKDSLARHIALNHVAIVADVYEQTGTIWENYAPDKVAPGNHADGKSVSKDFVGWSGIAPIKLFIEYAIGIKADAQTNAICWSITSDKSVGCKNFRFNGNTVSLKAINGKSSRTIEIKAEKAFTLKIICGGKVRNINVKSGAHTVKI